MLVSKDQERLLKKNQLFKGVPEQFLKTFILPKNFIEVKDGTVVYSCEEEASELYLVIDGEVKIKYCEDKNIELKIIFDFFGEAEILEGCKRFSFAVANSDCILYKIKDSELKSISVFYKCVSDNLNKNSTSDLLENQWSELPDLDTKLNQDKSINESEVIDFDQEKEEEMFDRLSEKDLDTIIEKQRFKNKSAGELDDMNNSDDE